MANAICPYCNRVEMLCCFYMHSFAQRKYATKAAHGARGEQGKGFSAHSVILADDVRQSMSCGIKSEIVINYNILLTTYWGGYI